MNKLKTFFNKPINCLSFLDKNSKFSKIFEKVIYVLIILWCGAILLFSVQDSLLSAMTFNKETNSLKVQKIFPLISKPNVIKISDINRVETFTIEKTESSGKGAVYRAYFNLKFILNSGEEKIPCSIENISENKIHSLENKINSYLSNNEQILTIYRYSVGNILWDLFALFMLIFLGRELIKKS